MSQQLQRDNAQQDNSIERSTAVNTDHSRIHLVNHAEGVRSPRPSSPTTTIRT
jgi:hypothetical protein